MDIFAILSDPLIKSIVVAVCAAVVTVLAARIILAVLTRRRGQPDEIFPDALRSHMRRPLNFAAPLIGILIAWPLMSLPPEIGSAIRGVVAPITVMGCGWLCIAMINVIADVIIARHRTEQTDNLDERRVLTQTQVLRRVAVIIVFLLTVTLLLISIPGAREIGVSLFASAGIAGLVIGLAARPTLSNLIAGVQIALTQPIRIDDVVIVEGEWGWIEEIRTTYVVVRIWDLRRLVVPLTYFIEKPFQNWTRTTADILGSVFVQVDYTVPVEEIRAELRRIAESSGHWDGKVCVLHVTEARERTLELRALLSAKDSPTAWELRCHVREKLIAFIERSHPDTLPRFRAEFDPVVKAA